MNIDVSKYQSPIKSPVENAKSKTGFDFLSKLITLFGKELSDKKKERFYSDLSILLSAGVDIKSALELIEEEQTKEADKKIFAAIKNKVISGGSISDAVDSTKKFSAYEYYSLKIGEESGRLTEVLEELSNYFSRRIQQKRQVVNALSYPCIVLVVAFGAIFFMLKFVVPMFSEVFKRFKGELPYLTKMVIHASVVFSDYFFLFFLILISASIFLFSQRKKTWFRKFFSSLLLKTPFIGDLITKIYLARFCQSMNLLISSKTPLVSAIDLVMKMVGFYPLEYSLEIVKEDILRGISLYQSLAKFKIYNKRMVSLIKVAEEVNELDMIFKKLAKQYTDEVEHKTGLIGSMIEPLMIIFLGILVAVILIAMYLPLFQLSTNIR
jgi:type IV pilus assembly protein PilC